MDCAEGSAVWFARLCEGAPRIETPRLLRPMPEAGVDRAFETPGGNAVRHCIAPDNIASAAVAQALDSVTPGKATLPAPLDTQDADCLGQIREQCFARRELRETASP